MEVLYMYHYHRGSKVDILPYNLCLMLSLCTHHLCNILAFASSSSFFVN